MTTDSSSTRSPTSRWPSASPSEQLAPNDASGASVNLLPQELAAALRARRVTRFTIGAVVLLVAVLGVVQVLRLAEVSRAEAARDEALQQVALLQIQLDGLAEFRQLAELMESRNALLASAMEQEIAYSQVLNNLSLAFPANASLQSLTIAAATSDGAPRTGEINFGEAVASAQFGGYSVERYAPGVETVLIDFDRVHTFFNTLLTTASSSMIAETEVTNFNGSVSLDRNAYTGRYADGLPPEAMP